MQCKTTDTLLENRRLNDLDKMVTAFEGFYRAELNQVVCQVTSAKELDSSAKSKVEGALKARAGSGAKLIVSYDTNPGIMGGLQVKMGEQVLDLEGLAEHMGSAFGRVGQGRPQPSNEMFENLVALAWRVPTKQWLDPWANPHMPLLSLTRPAYERPCVGSAPTRRRRLRP